MPRLVSLTLAFALQLRKKHGKTSVRVVKEIRKTFIRVLRRLMNNNLEGSRNGVIEFTCSDLPGGTEENLW